jgi:predicted ester cyclase
MSRDNIALVRRWFEEIWNERLETTIDELVDEDSVCYTDEGDIRGPEEFKTRQFRPLVDAFPDIRVEIEAIVAEGDSVVVRWTATGGHTGHGLGFKPTQETPYFRGITWVEVADGKLKQGWQSSNIPEVVRGLATRAPA